MSDLKPIPGFPIAGTTYITDDLNAEVREGDVVAWRKSDVQWAVEKLTKEHAEHCGQLAAWIDWDIAYGHSKGPQQGAYLIARADLEADT